MKIRDIAKLNREITDYREKIFPYEFKIEVSPKAIKNLEKKEKGSVDFFFGHNWEKDKKPEQLVFGLNKKSDYPHLLRGEINLRVNGWEGKFVCIKFNHIDVSVKIGTIETVVRYLAEWIDKKYGNNCGFKSYKDIWTNPIEII